MRNTIINTLHTSLEHVCCSDTGTSRISLRILTMGMIIRQNHLALHSGCINYNLIHGSQHALQHKYIIQQHCLSHLFYFTSCFYFCCDFLLPCFIMFKNHSEINRIFFTIAEMHMLIIHVYECQNWNLFRNDKWFMKFSHIITAYHI